MLPGFRFLLAAIVLSMSVLVFGLGAAALLRAAHEEFASTPAWRVAPEPKFARRDEAPKESSADSLAPVLAMLRVQQDPALQNASETPPAAVAPTEPQAIAAVPDEPEQLAALQPLDSAPPDAAEPEIPAAETSGPSEAAAIGTPTPAEEVEVEVATVQASPPADEAVAAAPEPAVGPFAADAGLTARKIATLGGPAVAIEPPPAVKTKAPVKTKAKVVATPDPSAVKKRLQARRTAERRRIALRERQRAAQQQAADPFAQPTITTRIR